MRITSTSLPVRLFAVLVTLLLVFGPASAAFAQTGEDVESSSTSVETEPAQTGDAEDGDAENGDVAATATAAPETEEAAAETEEVTATSRPDDAPKSSGEVTEPQPESTADDNETGANQDGPYDSTRDGSDSENGKGDPENSSKPCAGCVGKADNKNPPGQMPNGTDDNAGYECDRNEGVGQTNPAHTGCVEVQSNPSISLTKDGVERAEVGDTITYTFTVENTGNVELTGVHITDPLFEDTTIPVDDGTLAVDEEQTVSATYTVQEADVTTTESGQRKVDNTATVTGTPPTGADVTDVDEHRVLIPAEPELVPGITIEKTGPAEAEVGDTITYEFVVTNTGDVQLTGVTVTDPLLDGPITLDDTTLDVGESTDGSATYVVDEDDVVNGKVPNTATATGTPPEGDDVTDTDDHKVAVDTEPGEITVDFDCDGFDVTSTKDISNIIIEYRLDGALLTYKLDGLSGKTFSGDFSDYLPDGATVTAVYVKSGNNKSGDYPGAGERFDYDAVCDIQIVKSGPDSAYEDDEITYTFVITNVGTVTLTDVTLNDPLLGGAITLSDTTLSPGESVEAQADYTISEADALAGIVENTATTTGKTPDDETVEDDDDHDVDVPVTPSGPNPAVQIVKSGPDEVEVGETVTYIMEVTNVGDTPLTDVVVSDPDCDANTLTGPVRSGGNDDATLEDGEVWTYTCTRVMQEADAPSFTNTADVDATGPNNTPVNDDDDHTVTVIIGPKHTICHATGQPDKYVVITPSVRGVYNGHLGTDHQDGRDIIPPFTYDANGNGVIDGNETFSQNWDAQGQALFADDCKEAPAISLEKVASVASAEVGDVVSYQFTVTNTGNVNLYDVTIDDPDLDITDQVVPLGADDVFTVGEVATITASKTHTITAADLAAGEFVNVATVTGFTEDDVPVTDDGTDTVTVTDLPGAVQVTFDCTSVDLTSSKTISQVTILLVDGLGGSQTLSFVNVGDDFTYDTPAGWWVEEVAVTSGGGQPQEFTNDAVCTADIDLEKTGPSSTRVGNTVVYTFTVTNTGEADLRNVVLDDDQLGWVDRPVIDLLAAGEDITIQGSHTVTESDLSGPPGARVVVNNAEVTGTPVNGLDDVDDTDTWTIPIQRDGSGPNPDIELDKNGPSSARVGDVITYTFAVRNMGDTTLTNVHITDPLIGGGDIAVTPSTLAPRGQAGSTGTATATYTVRQADITVVNGLRLVHNEAEVEGTPPSGPPVTDTDDHDVEVPTTPPGPTPDIELDKNGPRNARIGDVITYTFSVRNTGNTQLTNVYILDPLLGSGQIAVTPSTLAAAGQPGSTGTATAAYTVDAGNVERINGAPTIHNEAEVFGTPPSGPPVTDTDEHDVLVPGLTLDKITDTTRAEVGEIINYSFVVTNTGGTTLNNVHITDPLLGGTIAVTPSTLAPGQTGIAGPIAYEVTAEDGVAGEVLNVAVARGTPPGGEPVEDEDDTTTVVPPTVTPAPESGLQLEKFGPETAREGDRITYRFRVTNTGETTLTDVHITDPLLGNGSIRVRPSTLAPGEQGTARATYVVRAADADRGYILNTATATGTPPSGPPVTDDDEHRTQVPSPVPGPGPEPEPEPEPDLPATGADVPTQLLAGLLAIMLGMFMVRRGGAVAPTTAEDANGFARRPRSSHGPARSERSSGRPGHAADAEPWYRRKR